MLGLLTISSIAFVLGIPVAYALDSCVVPNGSTYYVDEHSECREVTNSTAGGLDILVPTKTANEWSTGGSNFISNLPTGVTLAACSGGGGGSSIIAGSASTCGIGSDTKIYCWGNNTSGQLGDGTTTTRSTPNLTSNGDNTAGTYKKFGISVAGTSICAIGMNDKAYCWGANGNGQLGDNTTTERHTPVLTLNGANPTGTYTAIAIGAISACGIGVDNKSYCWGQNNAGQLGDNTTTERHTPVLTLNGANPTGTYKKLTQSGAHPETCGIGMDDKAYCWGWNNWGQGGDNTTTQRNTPTLVLNGANPTGTYKEISAGMAFTCGIGMDDKAYCWGYNNKGQLGDNTTTQRNMPVLVLNGANPTGTYKKIASGGNSVCAIGTNDKSYCWGDNSQGQLGDNTTTERHTPTLVLNGANPTGTYKEITKDKNGVFNFAQTCGISMNDKAYCWGHNFSSQLGDGTTTQRNTPVLVSNGDNTTGTYGSAPITSCTAK